MSAEKGWVGEPQPPQEWHTPGWLSEKGTGRSHFQSDKYAAKQHILRDAAGLGFPSDSEE